MVAMKSEVKNRFVSDHSGDERSVEDVYRERTSVTSQKCHFNNIHTMCWDVNKVKF